MDLARRLRNVRLAALIMEGDLRVDPGISVAETAISGILRFSPKFSTSHFLYKCHLSV